VVSFLGVAIVKRSIEEQKLCTLWVNKSMRGNGVAGSLVESAFRWLGTSWPLFTIPEERMDEFRGLLNRWDYSIAQREFGMYRPRKIEYVFNGRVKPGLSS
jgi:hypothetical protein